MKLGERTLTVAAVVLLVLSTALNVAVVMRGTSANTARKAPPQGLTPGDRIENLAVTPISGGDKNLNLSGKHLLLVFSAKCPYCRASIPAWQKLARDSPSAAPIFVSVDNVREAAEFAKQYSIPEDKIVVLDPASRMKLKTGSVPQTILIADGRVVRASIGEFQESSIREYEKEN